ncbi:hypothetical protein [Deinococcus misasensis]|uniref:hypothetical protein n=1 Tax=Deinococcus misasensis TaxID=392413 RepID=UPI00054E53A3|nr:hypothetical protein [Deinococcus misasensis]
MKHKIILTSLLLASGLSLAAPLNRYVPETALAEFQLNGLSNIKPQITTLIDLESTLLDAGLKYDDAKIAQNLLWGGLGTESSLSVHMVKNDVEVLAVTRVGKSSNKQVQSLMADLAKGKKKPTKLKEGRFVFFAQDGMYYGFQDGLAYVGSHPQLLREFLKRLQNSKLAGLSSQQSFQSTMLNDGGNFKAFVNLKSLMNLVLKEIPQSDQKEFPQAIQALRSLQGLSLSASFTKTGLDGTSVMSFQNLSPELQRLLSYSKTQFNAEVLLRPDVQGYGVNAVDLQGWMDYFVGLVPELKDNLPEAYDRFKGVLGTEMVGIYPAATSGKALSSLAGTNALFGLEITDPEQAQTLLDELVQELEAMGQKDPMTPEIDEDLTEDGMTEMDHGMDHSMDDPMMDEGMEDLFEDFEGVSQPEVPQVTVEKLDGDITCLNFADAGSTASMGELAALSSVLGDAMKVCFKIHQKFLMVGLGADLLNNLPNTPSETLTPSKQQTLFGNRALTGFQWIGADYFKNYASQLRLSNVMLNTLAQDSTEKEAVGFASTLLSGLANLADRTQENVTVSYFENNRVITKSNTTIDW